MADFTWRGHSQKVIAEVTSEIGINDPATDRAPEGESDG